MPAVTLWVTVFQWGGYVFLAPGVVGLLRWLKARLQGRQGPSLWQPYRDLWKLFHRRPIVPETASWLFSVAPLVAFGCYVFSGLLLPVVYLPPEELLGGVAPGWPRADLVVIISLLGLARFAEGLAGMDAGNPYGDLGSSRVMFLHFLAEPTLFLCAYALVLLTRTTSLPGILYQLQLRSLAVNPPLWLVLLALALLALAEAGRLPFESPTNHLELTMQDRAIQIEYGGPQLALLAWTEALRLTFFATLLLNLGAPALLARVGQPWLQQVGLILSYPLKMLSLLLLLAGWEATRTKLRLSMVSRPLGLALVLAGLAVILAVLSRYGA